jgi:DNA-binding NarL/FixJ family response regulator
MSHPRVLIVEDHPLMADALRVHLRSMLTQMICVHANSMQQGLWCLQQAQGFELVLLDLNLPDSQGIDTLNAFCAARFSGPLVVVSALQDPEVVQACLANNVTFISKSTPSFRLQTELLAILAKKHQAPLCAVQTFKRLAHIP